MAKLLALDKWARLMRTFKANGGFVKSIIKMYWMDTLKKGRKVGTDALGNSYFENDRYRIGRNRWVEFNPHVGLNYDGSQIPAEWYGWMHYKTDRLPCCDPMKVERKNCADSRRWLLPYRENVTGTPLSYYPYSTTRPKIEPWNGKSFKLS